MTCGSWGNKRSKDGDDDKDDNEHKSRERKRVLDKLACHEFPVAHWTPCPSLTRGSMRV